jgi:hypothetical protein
MKESVSSISLYMNPVEKTCVCCCDVATLQRETRARRAKTQDSQSEKGYQETLQLRLLILSTSPISTKYHTQTYHTTQDISSSLLPLLQPRPSARPEEKQENPNTIQQKKDIIINHHLLQALFSQIRQGTVNPEIRHTIQQTMLAMLAHSNHE